ncbi:SCO family protein [Ramlibacter sp. MAHUQ-53]|uniref:SCO family protein n=1 Tax=unclassified Ramlibacter TaxID=2617605 RepID=UPI00364525CC
MNRRFALASLAAAAFLSACGQSKPPFHSVDVTGADYAKDFALTDHDGQPRTLQDFRGKLVVLFFGYTQCPDVCPTTLTDLAEVKRQLGPDGDKLQGLFVTVDPERDTPEVLKAYMANFDPAFLALRGTPAQLEEVAKDFKVYYKKVEGKAPGAYTMDHSAAHLVYDTQGRLRLYVRPGTGPKVLAEDLKLLLKS